MVVVDLMVAFTDQAWSLGADLGEVVSATRELLDAARERAVPVAFTTIEYGVIEELGVWVQKIPGLADLRAGTPAVELDQRLGRLPTEPVFVKKGASALFASPVGPWLVGVGADTVVLCGATTSGCVRATVVDLVQWGWPCVIPRECVGDREHRPHEAALYDIDLKYGDVVNVQEALSLL